MVNDQSRAPGFTLIEMVTVITLTGIIAVVVSMGIREPIQGFVDLSKRAELVDVAELALRRMSREIRLALPNSVRISDGATQGLQTCTASAGSTCAVEFLRTLDGGRYRSESDGTDNTQCASDTDLLDFTAGNDCFEILGALTSLPTAVPGAVQSDCLQGDTDCMAIFNTGQPGANAYDGDNIAAIQSASADAVTFDISPESSFPLQSPRQRFHIVDMPVSFVCASGAGTVTRHADYPIAAVQSTSPGGSSTLLANRVQSCRFAYSQGTGSRNALLTAEVVISDTDSAGNANNVRMIEQIQVPNVP
ncbi:MAG: type II secretion system protein [Gammaproteobacteria bacterium]|nr:type II secretion system protein [Gammaproteobacteria bacterium]